jgi:hypothetical protein
VSLNIKVPDSGNEVFKGQIITVTHNPRDKILDIKSHLSRKLNSKIIIYLDIPFDSFLIKTYTNEILGEENSIAFYNINNNDFLEIELNRE